MTEHTNRLPAEWEPQAGVLLAWPHAQTDWAERLAETESAYVALVAAITRFEKDHNLPPTGQATPRLRRELATATGRPLD